LYMMDTINNTIRLRDAVEADIPQIREIYCHYVRTSVATFEEDEPSCEEMKRRWSDITREKMPYFVAEELTEATNTYTIVGYSYATLYRTRSAYRYTLEDSIYLHPAHCGKGLGTVLLDHLIKESTRLGFRQMIAVIGGSDNHGSIKLHEKMGFGAKHILDCVGLKFGRWVDVVTLQLALGDGS
ncbi:hypothetical protein SAMD00019534_051520, partial [Acytostelium subglobosum LB1]|uniref:hypothetical protein n=1 Tax=Acytostelium subglobosum LB1 TaxID=1410327 RepID=UPI000644ABBA